MISGFRQLRVQFLLDFSGSSIEFKISMASILDSRLQTGEDSDRVSPQWERVIALHLQNENCRSLLKQSFYCNRGKQQACEECSATQPIILMGRTHVLVLTDSRFDMWTLLRRRMRPRRSPTFWKKRSIRLIASSLRWRGWLRFLDLFASGFFSCWAYWASRPRNWCASVLLDCTFSFAPIRESRGGFGSDSTVWK
jgi:hypothetical protein